MDRYIQIMNDCIKKTQPAWQTAIRQVSNLLMQNREQRKRVYFIGNGGSAGIALHMAADFQKTAEIRTQTFYDPTLLTCMGNDYGYEYVFSKPLEINADEGDLLIAISSSGESANVINGVKAAKDKGCEVITFSGFKKGNTLSTMGDINVYVPIEEYGIVESIHNLMLQQVIDEIKMTLKERD